jgi:hypothetical protein
MTLIVPLWAVTITEWPIALRRIQTTIALLIGLIGVSLATVISPEQLGELGEAHWTAAVIVTLLTGTALRVVPGRLLDESG